MDEIDHDSLKNGNGKEENKKFFLMVSQILQQYEETNYDIDCVKHSETVQELREYERLHHVLDKLSEVRRTEGYRDLVDGKDGYFILIMNTEQEKTDIHFFEESDEATRQYDLFESQKNDYEDIVLVATDSIDTLERAYPNYFSSIQEFVQLVRMLIS